MKSKSILFQIALAIATASFAAGASAAMYKWTDKEGSVHYSEIPPEEGHATEIAPPPPPPAQPASDDDSQAGDENGTKEKGASAPLSKEQQDIMIKNCQTAQANLELYNSAKQIKQADGKVVDMTDEAKEKKIQEAQEQIKKFCK